jgi:hypothetical protein
MPKRKKIKADPKPKPKRPPLDWTKYNQGEHKAKANTQWAAIGMILGPILSLVGFALLTAKSNDELGEYTGLLMLIAGIAMFISGAVFVYQASPAGSSGGGSNQGKRKDPYYKDFAHKKAFYDQIEKNLDDIFE